jgi:hypothetical protein
MFITLCLWVVARAYGTSRSLFYQVNWCQIMQVCYSVSGCKFGCFWH